MTSLYPYSLKTIKKFLYIFFCICTVITVSAQSPMFQVIHLPRQAGITKLQLNNEIAGFKNQDSVKKFLQKKKFPPKTTVLIRIIRTGNIHSLWTIPLGSASKEDNSIVFRSKDNATTRFFKLSDFKAFFRDTVAIIDTLAIEMYLKDRDYPDDQYQLSYSCGAESQQTNPIPFYKSKLLFTQALLNGCSSQPVMINIRNQNAPDRTLAACSLLFLSADQKETLTDLALYYKEQQPESNSKEIRQLVASYAVANMGKLYFPQLVALLSPILL